MIKRKKDRILEDFVNQQTIFGDTAASVSDRIPTTLKKKEKVKIKVPTKPVSTKPVKSTKPTSSSSGIPGVEVQRPKLPPEALGIDPSKITNVINIPEHLLLTVKRKSDQYSDQYSKFLMTDVIPKLMAFNAGNSYVQTAMSDGLGIDIDIDHSVADVLENLMRLDVIVFFLKKSVLPLKYKRELLSHLVEKLSTSCIEKMDKSHKKQERENFIKDVEGVVVRSYSKKVNDEIQDKVRTHNKRSNNNPGHETVTQRQQRPRDSMPQPQAMKQNSGILQQTPAPMAKRKRR